MIDGDENTKDLVDLRPDPEVLDDNPENWDVSPEEDGLTELDTGVRGAMALLDGPGVYVLRLDRPLDNPSHPNQFYLGSAKNLLNRLVNHATMKRRSFLGKANQLGIGWTAVKVWLTNTEEEARELEAKFKAAKRTRLVIDKPGGYAQHTIALRKGDLAIKGEYGKESK